MSVVEDLNNAEFREMRERAEKAEAALTQERNSYAVTRSGMYVNCVVYCGHRYGPKGKVLESMVDTLKAHVEWCPAHPMSVLKKRVEELEGVLRGAGFYCKKHGEYITDLVACPGCWEERKE